MKTFLAEYNWNGAYGAFEYKDVVVIAESESAALGLVLMSYEDTQAENWTFKEINTKIEGVYYVSSDCN